MRRIALLFSVLLGGCAGGPPPDERFLAADMSAGGEGWRPLRFGHVGVWEAASNSGCLALLGTELPAAWLPGFEFRGHFLFEEIDGDRYRVVAFHRLPEATHCGPLWTYEYCTFSARRSLDKGFWGIRGPRICLADGDAPSP